jgi:regulator of RNase E activity RraA
VKHWNSDEELYDTIRRELFTAVVGDVMDTMGLLRQFLPPQIKPLRDDMVVIGRAMTVLEADVFAESHGATGFMSEPFGLMFRALDDLKSGEIYICAGASPRYALWGELMSTRAMKLGAAGAVVDGYHRDTRGILELDFPSFSYGAYAQDQAPRGKVIDFRVPLEIGGVRVMPGDIVFGDLDGVCVIPRAAEEEVFRKALEKVQKENLVGQAIEDGMSAQEAFKMFGVM